MATITSLNFQIRASWNGAALNRARDDLAALRAQMRTISGASLHFEVDADTEEARAKIEALRAQARDIQMGVDLNDAQMATAEARLDILARDREVEIRVNDNDSARKVRDVADAMKNAEVNAVSFGNSSHRAGYMAKLAMAGFAAALVVLPGLINLVGTSLTGVMGAGLIAVGVIALKENEKLKASYTHLWEDLKAVTTEAAQPMLQPLLDALDMVHTRLYQLKPAFTELFSAASIGIKPLTDGFLNFIQNLMPGLTSALEQSGPMVQGFADGMGMFGDRLSKMFEAMSGGAEGFGRIWRITFDQVGFMMEQFGIAAGNMSETGTNLWDRLLTGFNQFLGGFLTGMTEFTEALDTGITDGLSILGIFGDLLGGTLGPIGELSASLSNVLMPVLDAVKTALIPVVDALALALKPAIDALIPLADELRPLIIVIGNSLADAIRSIAPLLPPLVTALVDALVPAFEMLLPVLPVLIEQFANGIIPFLQMMPGVIERLTPVMLIMVQLFLQLVQWAAPLIPHLMQLYVAWKLIFAAMAVGRAITAAYTAVTAALSAATLQQTIRQWALNIAMKANVIGLIIVAVAALVAAIIWLATKTQFFQRTWEIMKNVAAAIWQWMQDVWDNTVRWFVDRWNTVSGAITGAWTASWEWIKNAAKVVWDWITGAWEKTVNGLKVAWDAFSAPFKAAFEIWWFAVRAIVAVIWAWIEVVWNAVWTSVKAIWDGFSTVFMAIWQPFWDGVTSVARNLWEGARNVWNAVWNAISDKWNAFSSWFSGVWNAAWTWVSDFVSGKWNWVRDRWNDMWNWVADRWNAFSAWFSGIWNTAWTAVADFVSGKWNWIRDRWNDMWNWIADRWNAFSDWLRGVWDGFWSWVRDLVGGIWDWIVQKWNDVSGALTGSFDTMVAKAREIWDKIREVFAKPINFVIRIWNDHVAGKFGLPELTPIEGFATGGRVDGKGTGTSDDVPARLSRGEHVWTAREVDAAGGHGNVEALRRNALNGVAHYASGGPVEWMIGQQEKVAPALQVTSSYRDSNDYHGQGKAVDFSNGGDAGTPEMMAFANWIADTWGANTLELIHSPFARNIKDGQSVGDGMGFYGPGTMAQHRNHVHWAVDRPLNEDEGGKGILGKIWGGIKRGVAWTFEKLSNPIINAIPSPFFPGVGDPYGGFPKSAAKKLQQAFLEKVRGAEGDTGMAGGDIGGMIPDGERLAIINEALRVTNTPPPSTLEAWQAGMNTLIERESNWNPGAINNWDSNAAAGNSSRGLAQVIPTTFEAYKAPGHNDIYAPVDNVAASINYIKDRYGTIENVQQANANMPPKGYETGTGNAPAGWALVGENGPEAVNFRGGEQVKTFDDIISALRDSATGEVRTLEAKVSTELRSTMDRLGQVLTDDNRNNREQVAAEIRALVERVSGDVNASGARFAQSVEDAIERVLAAAGMQLNLTMPIPQNAGDAAAYAQEVANQLLPQLEMMIRQRVGAR